MRFLYSPLNKLRNESFMWGFLRGCLSEFSIREFRSSHINDEVTKESSLPFNEDL